MFLRYKLPEEEANITNRWRGESKIPLPTTAAKCEIKMKKRVFCKCDTLVLLSKRKILQLSQVSHDKSHSFIPK